jgi:nuclease HARBI1
MLGELRTNIGRFDKDEIAELTTALHIDSITFSYGIKASPQVAFAVLCYILARPNSLAHAPYFFGRSAAWVSHIYNDVLQHLNNRYADFLHFDPIRVNLSTIGAYCQAIEEVAGPVRTWGFIDGTLRPHLRPMVDEAAYYTAYKKVHAMKYEAIMAPDGLMVHLGGPKHSRESDWRLWQHVGIGRKLGHMLGHMPVGERPRVYGDRAYFASTYIYGSFRRGPGEPYLPFEERQFNAASARHRIVVEQGFAKVVNLWAHVNHIKGLRQGVEALGTMYRIAVLLTNLHTCLRQSQVGMHFNMRAPTVEEYLHGI